MIRIELIKKFRKEGELLIIWKCEECGKILPFYRSKNKLINMIHLCWARDHKYCSKCEEKRKGIKKPKPKENPAEARIKDLLNIYEDDIQI